MEHIDGIASLLAVLVSVLALFWQQKLSTQQAKFERELSRVSKELDQTLSQLQLASRLVRDVYYDRVMLFLNLRRLTLLGDKAVNPHEFQREMDEKKARINANLWELIAVASSSEVVEVINATNEFRRVYDQLNEDRSTNIDELHPAYQQVQEKIQQSIVRKLKERSMSVVE